MEMNADQVADAMANIVMGQSAPAAAQEPSAPPAPVPDTVTASDDQGQVEVSEQVEEQTETIEIDPDAELFDMELEENGQKVSKKLSLREFQKGYLRQADYTRKTQDLARQRAEAHEVSRQAGQEAAKQYLQKLETYRDALVKAIEPEFANVDMRQLANDDPFKWATLTQRANDFNRTLQAIEQERSQVEQQSKQEDQKRKAGEWAKTLEMLQQEIPDWSQPVVHRIIKAAKDAGATETEATALDQGWIIKLAHKAAMYDDLQSKRPEVEKKVALVTKTLKPGNKVTPNRTDDRIQQWRKSGGKLNSDGAALFDKFV